MAALSKSVGGNEQLHWASIGSKHEAPGSPRHNRSSWLLDFGLRLFSSSSVTLMLCHGLAQAHTNNRSSVHLGEFSVWLVCETLWWFPLRVRLVMYLATMNGSFQLIHEQLNICDVFGSHRIWACILQLLNSFYFRSENCQIGQLISRSGQQLWRHEKNHT